MYLIRSWLFIGCYRDTLDEGHLQRHQIGAMLQLAEAVEQPGISSLYLPVEDGVALCPIHLNRGVEFTLEHRRQGHVVLIACGAGQSRSVAYGIAALKQAEGIGLVEAMREMIHGHPQIMLHPTLWKSLCHHYGEVVSFRTMQRALDTGGTSAEPC